MGKYGIFVTNNECFAGNGWIPEGSDTSEYVYNKMIKRFSIFKKYRLSVVAGVSLFFTVILFFQV